MLTKVKALAGLNVVAIIWWVSFIEWLLDAARFERFDGWKCWVRVGVVKVRFDGITLVESFTLSSLSASFAWQSSIWPRCKVSATVVFKGEVTVMRVLPWGRKLWRSWTDSRNKWVIFFAVTSSTLLSYVRASTGNTRTHVMDCNRDSFCASIHTKASSRRGPHFGSALKLLQLPWWYLAYWSCLREDPLMNSGWAL